MPLLLVIQPLINKGRNNPELRESLGKLFHPRGAGNQVEKQNPVLRNPLLLQYLHRQCRRSSYKVLV